MRAIPKNQLISEIANRQREAVKRGSTETSSQTASRLIGSLMKEWVNPEGKIWSLRAYLLKYDRKEYAHILNAIKLHLQMGASFFNQQKCLDKWYLTDFDSPYKQSVAFDGRIKTMKLR